MADTRPTQDEHKVGAQLHVRIPEDLRGLIDKYADLASERAGYRVPMQYVIEQLLRAGLNEKARKR